MRRLGLVWRVALTVLAALIALQLLAAGGYYLERSRATQSGLKLPLPDQVAALVTLLDRAEPEQRALVLRAVNGVGMRVNLQRDAPS
ncbi:MAG TPA: hypothetical protein VLX85_15095, partial [Stellaceae bacterium]|nr:hypothetical protein [Stellaceae bacterium]